MTIIKKLRTAGKVFFKHGIREVFVLLRANIERYTLRYYRKAVSRLAHVCYRLFLTGDKAAKPHTMRILFITNRIEAEYGQTIRYRIFNLKEALKDTAEIRLEVIEDGIYKDRDFLKWADLIIFMRLDWSAMAEEVIDAAKSLSVPVAYDIDDIVFLEEYAENFCRVLNESDNQKISVYREKFKKYGDVFEACDFSTTSTFFIQEKMAAVGKRAFVIHNGLNQKQLKIASKIDRNMEKATVYISYFSGSDTHNRDFYQVIPTLERILGEYDHVRIRIAGYLDTDQLPRNMAEKTEIACYMKWTRLLKYGAQNTINIAPLDISNPFCHAKSELKYFEAAIVGVPTVASATDTYKRCIVNGVNGMLASNEEEWYVALKALLDDKELYESVRENAYKQVIENYTPQAIAKEAMSVYQSIIKEYKK